MSEKFCKEEFNCPDKSLCCPFCYSLKAIALHAKAYLMKKPVFIFLLFFILTPIYSQTDPLARGIEEQIVKILEITSTPATAIAIVKEEKVIYTRGFGYRDYENKINVVRQH